MNQTKRFIYQVVFWLIIWLSQWLLQGYSVDFISSNIKVYLFQITLTAIVIFYTAPKFLFKKKHLVFSLISITLITAFSYISFGNTGVPGGVPPPPHPHPPHTIPPGQGLHGPGGKFSFTIFPPSRIFINFLLLTITYFVATFFEGFIFIRKKEEEVILNKSENLETELKLLKSQINPHFLFNALNNIYALSAISTTKTQESIIYLSGMLRYVLYECEQKLVPLEKEILYIENYIKLFCLKSSKKFPINLYIDSQNSSVLVAPMLFLPYVENAFKHSNIERGKDSFISIEIKTTDNTIDFLIKNSTPVQKTQKDDIGGIGLINVKKRLSILYPDKHTLDIQEKNNTFSVKLTIQLD